MSLRLNISRKRLGLVDKGITYRDGHTRLNMFSTPIKITTMGKISLIQQLRREVGYVR